MTDPATGMIFNHGSGPGTSVDSTIQSAMNTALYTHGTKTYGYVNTGHGNIAEATVKSQVDDWYSWYTTNLCGIYFDNAQCDNNSAHLSYYEDLSNYVRAKTGGYDTRVIFGYGAIPGLETYMSYCDHISVWENSYNGSSSNWPSTVSKPSWWGNYTSDHYIAWMYQDGTHGLTSTNMELWVDNCYNYGINNVFATTTVNGYNGIPSWLSTEMTYVASK